MEQFTFAAYAAASKNNEEKVRQLKDNPTLQRMMKRNRIPEAYVESHPYTVERWLNGFLPCAACRGLDTCTQKTKGYYENLIYDGIVKTELTACRYQREEEAATAHEDSFLFSHMDPRLLKVSFRQAVDSEAEKGAAKKYLVTAARVYDLMKADRSVYLLGPMGTGKTYLAACAANAAAKKGRKVCFVVWPRFVSEMAARIRENEYMQDFAKLMYCEFLVIDDLGAESATEWNRDSLLFTLLNQRCQAGSQTWFTSNCDLTALEQHFTFTKNNEDELKAKRIIERIRAMAEIVELNGRDRRISV